jgi:hypothetical protein
LSFFYIFQIISKDLENTEENRKKIGKYRRKLLKDMKNMEERQV